ncbi:OsmC family protein [Flavobacterium coralii]|uniref:OsmC family protein n=1 Tax=Flavobacterium coralii TaxID=2838017 RepID=UPI000C510FE8|nr:osmotically inducible protein OsmC [Flavobacterium sp.]|tara:strand:- start:8404 stop:8814 length:411 start_codon:yes stop_codon:yes gene_type:complete
MTSKVTYLGDLRTSSVHIQSGSEIISDAPLDNNGKGEAFSPTDTVANALASCMFTVMGIKARDIGVKMKGSVAEVTKIMQASPRKISEIKVEITMQSDADEKARTILERTAMSCPVLLSLNPDIEKKVTFNWNSIG